MEGCGNLIGTQPRTRHANLQDPASRCAGVGPVYVVGALPA